MRYRLAYTGGNLIFCFKDKYDLKTIRKKQKALEKKEKAENQQEQRAERLQNVILKLDEARNSGSIKRIEKAEADVLKAKEELKKAEEKLQKVVED